MTEAEVISVLKRKLYHVVHCGSCGSDRTLRHLMATWPDAESKGILAWLGEDWEWDHCNPKKAAA